MCLTQHFTFRTLSYDIFYSMHLPLKVVINVTLNKDILRHQIWSFPTPKFDPIFKYSCTFSEAYSIRVDDTHGRYVSLPCRNRVMGRYVSLFGRYSLFSSTVSKPCRNRVDGVSKPCRYVSKPCRNRIVCGANLYIYVWKYIYMGWRYALAIRFATVSEPCHGAFHNID